MWFCWHLIRSCAAKTKQQNLVFQNKENNKSSKKKSSLQQITSSWRNLEVNIKLAKSVSNIWCQTTPFSQDYCSNMKRILNMIQNEWIEKLSVDEDPNEVSSKSKTAISSTNHFPSTTYYLLTSKVLALLQNPSQRISRKSLKSHSTLSQN